MELNETNKLDRVAAKPGEVKAPVEGVFQHPHDADLERQLLEGVDSPVGEMTSEDWAYIRREAFARIAAQNKG